MEQGSISRALGLIQSQKKRSHDTRGVFLEACSVTSHWACGCHCFWKEEVTHALEIGLWRDRRGRPWRCLATCKLLTPLAHGKDANLS